MASAKVHLCDNPACLKGPTNNLSSLLACTRCKYAVYCGKDCAKADWKAHKYVCIAVAEQPKEVAKSIKQTSLRILRHLQHQLSEIGDFVDASYAGNMQQPGILKLEFIDLADARHFCETSYPFQEKLAYLSEGLTVDQLDETNRSILKTEVPHKSIMVCIVIYDHEERYVHIATIPRK